MATLIASNQSGIDEQRHVVRDGRLRRRDPFADVADSGLAAALAELAGHGVIALFAVDLDLEVGEVIAAEVQAFFAQWSAELEPGRE